MNIKKEEVVGEGINVSWMNREEATERSGCYGWDDRQLDLHNTLMEKSSGLNSVQITFGLDEDYIFINLTIA